MSNKDFNAKVNFIITDGKDNGDQYRIQSEVKGQTGYIVIGLADVFADILADLSPEDAASLLLKFTVLATSLSKEVRNEREADSTN